MNWIMRAGEFCFIMVILLALVIGSMLPVPIPLVIVIPTIIIYYWSLIRADFLRSEHVFLTGLLQDILTGAPLGLNALMALLVRAVALSQNRFFLYQSQMLVILAFGVTLAADLTIQWLLALFIQDGVVDFRPLLWAWLVGVGLCLPMIRVLARLTRFLAISKG